MKLVVAISFLGLVEVTACGSNGQPSNGADAHTTDGKNIDSHMAIDANTPHDGATGHIENVFIIMMENHNATSIYGSADAPYINNTLLAAGAHATQYNTHVHPSETNYLWLEAGDNLGVTDDNDPTSAGNEQTTTDHLTTQLTHANISWKSYVETIDGTSCPLVSSPVFGSGTFAVKHTPQLFFSDVTDNFSPTSATCIAHVRPFTELATDLQAGTVPRYSFITPDLCNDMHGALACITENTVATGDTWLQTVVPTILQSNAFHAGGLLLIVWDEGDEPLGGTASDGPLPFIAIGDAVKTNYAGNVSYTHSSTLKTVERIFGVPLLRGAADAATNDLGDMFTFPP
jgi:phosphatidylinositol-3-phosphatase